MRSTKLFVAALAALSLVAAACGSDDESTSTDAPSTEAPVETDAATTDAPTTDAPTTDAPADTDAPAETVDVNSALDTNGDGKVVIGIAAAGPADDGAYYQAVVDGATALSDGERIRRPDRGRQHPGCRRRHADGRPRPAGRRRHHRRCVRDRRAAAGAHRGVPGHLLVLQLRRRLPREPRSGPEHRQRCRDRLHRRLRNRVCCCRTAAASRPRSSGAATSASRSSRTWRTRPACKRSIPRTR